MGKKYIFRIHKNIADPFSYRKIAFIPEEEVNYENVEKEVTLIDPDLNLFVDTFNDLIKKYWGEMYVIKEIDGNKESVIIYGLFDTWDIYIIKNKLNLKEDK